MKCYSVGFDGEILVVAETEDEARQIARNGAIADDLGVAEDGDFVVRVARRLPRGWGSGGIVYGGDGTMTAEKAMLLNKQD